MEFFKVADYLSPVPEIIDAKKPPLTKVSIEEESDGHRLVYPAEGFTMGNVFFFCVGFFAMFLAIFFKFEGNLNPALFFTVLSIVCFVSFIFGSYSTYSVEFNHQHLVFTRAIFGFKKVVSRRYDDWEKIRLEKTDNDDRITYIIWLYFFKSTSISLPRSSEFAEQQWIISQLYKIKDDLALKYSRDVGTLGA